MNRPLRASGILAASGVFAFVGYAFINPDTVAWYDALVKPSLVPPDELFLPTWLITFALAIGAAFIIWLRKPESRYAETWMRFFFLQLLFSSWWILFFFVLNSLFFSLIDGIVVAFTLLAMTLTAWEMDGRAALLFLPYSLLALLSAFLMAILWYINN